MRALVWVTSATACWEICPGDEAVVREVLGQGLERCWPKGHSHCPMGVGWQWRR